MITIAAIATLALGTLAAWYETAVLLGSVSALKLLAGFALETPWICFVTSLVAAFTSVLRSHDQDRDRELGPHSCER